MVDAKDVYLYPAATSAYDVILRYHGQSIVTTRTTTYEIDALLKKLGIPKTNAIDILLKKPSVKTTFLIDSLLKRLGLTKTDSVDVLFKMLGIPKTYEIDVLFKKLNVTITDSIDVLFKKLGKKQSIVTDILLKKVGIQQAVFVDVILVLLQTYAGSIPEPREIKLKYIERDYEVPTSELQIYVRQDYQFKVGTLDLCFDVDLPIIKPKRIES